MWKNKLENYNGASTVSSYHQAQYFTRLYHIAKLVSVNCQNLDEGYPVPLAACMAYPL
jgi:hypothetical protein